MTYLFGEALASIANVDDKKEAITVQSLLDMTSDLEWTEPLSCAEFSINGASITIASKFLPNGASTKKG